MLSPLEVVHEPPRGGGRPQIFGTVLASGLGHPDETMCLVRRLASLPEDVGGTGSPRVEIWLALTQADLSPRIVRRATRNRQGDWELLEPFALDGMWATEVIEALGRLGYRLTDWRPGDQDPDWPTSIHDRRIILPDDDRWSGPPALAESINGLLARRNHCQDDEVWRIDAMILGLALRA